MSVSVAAQKQGEGRLGRKGPFSVDEFAADAARRQRSLTLAVCLLSLFLGGAFIAFGLDSPLLPLVLLTGGVVLGVLWCKPEVMLWLLLLGSCLFELFPRGYPDSLTDRIPLFWQVNTIFQVHLHANVKAFPFLLVEYLLFFAGLSALLKSIFFHRTSLLSGPLLTPITIYLSFVVIGWLNGIANGGDFKDSLREIRSQFYLIIAYLLAVNVFKSKSEIHKVFWVSVICIGIKGALYTFRRYVTLAGLPVSDQGVGSHEEAFFFNCFVLLLISLWLTGSNPHLRRVMWILLPLVIIGNLACNRRAGTGAIVVALPALVAAAYFALPDRRKLIGGLVAAFLIVGPLYYHLFKNSNSIVAQPARAVKSHFNPDPRDAGSNAYRDAENFDIMATLRLSPIIGYGYGRRMLHAAPIADISNIYEFWDLLPHNSLLWIWMRTGTCGFLAFWMMIASMLIRAARVACFPEVDETGKALSLFAVGITIMLVIFGMLDLQLSCPRDLLFVGVVIGLLDSPLFSKRWDIEPAESSMAAVRTTAVKV